MVKARFSCHLTSYYYLLARQKVSVDNLYKIWVEELNCDFTSGLARSSNGRMLISKMHQGKTDNNFQTVEDRRLVRIELSLLQVQDWLLTDQVCSGLSRLLWQLKGFKLT